MKIRQAKKILKRQSTYRRFRRGQFSRAISRVRRYQSRYWGPSPLSEYAEFSKAFLAAVHRVLNMPRNFSASPSDYTFKQGLEDAKAFKKAGIES